LNKNDTFGANSFRYKSKVAFQNFKIDFTNSNLGVLKQDKTEISGKNLINNSIINTLKSLI
jgi:hypothetical protein